MIHRNYTTNDVVHIAKITHRQAQWLDEKSLISPKHFGHTRIWSFENVVEVAIIAELRRKGLSLQPARRVIRHIQRDLSRRWSDVIRCGTDVYLLVDGDSVIVEDRRDRIIDRLKATSNPAFLVSVSEQARRVVMYRSSN